MGCAWGSNSNHRVVPDKAPIVHVKTTESSSLPPVSTVENTSVCRSGSNGADDRQRLTSSHNEVEVVPSTNVGCCAPPPRISSPSPESPNPPTPKPRRLELREIETQTLPPVDMVDRDVQTEKPAAVKPFFAARSFDTSNNQANSIQDCYQGNPGSLRDAFKELDDDGNNSFEDQIEEAQQCCNKTRVDGLKNDESAALYLYSMRSSDNSIYNNLHEALGRGQESEIKKWIEYLKLLRSAWEKLPLISNEVWQGIDYDEELVDKICSSNIDELFTCIGSCTPLTKVVQSSFQDASNPKRKLLMFGYEGVGAKDITSYIEGDHREVMLWPGKRINQVRFEEKADGSQAILHLSYEPEQIHVQMIGEITYETTPAQSARTPSEPSVRAPSEPSARTSSEQAAPTERTVTFSDENSITTSIPLILPPPMSHRTGHFNCPNKICTNACDGWHSSNHCRGISHLSHYCNHHCGAGYIVDSFSMKYRLKTWSLFICRTMKRIVE